VVILAERAGDGIHVIDRDYRRRARIVQEFAARSMHAEIYENLEEFASHAPRTGFVFAADDPASGCGPKEIADVMQSHGVLLPLVVYAHEPSAKRIVSAMLDGAFDYLEWPFDPRLLDAALSKLASEGERRTEQTRLRSIASAKVKGLTRREREVLILVTRGLSNNQIAETLQISPRTVEIHRANMMKGLDASSVADAVRMAIYAGVDDDDFAAATS
jgi:two-component system, LuxR family, response regulator FixJ